MFTELNGFNKLSGNIGYYYILELSDKTDNSNIKNTYIKCGVTQQPIKNRLYSYRTLYDIKKYVVFTVKKYILLEKSIKCKYAQFMIIGDEYIDGSKVNYQDVVECIKRILKDNDLEVN